MRTIILWENQINNEIYYLKVDCNRDIWVLKGANCYPYPTYPLGACMEWEFVTFCGQAP